MSEDASLTSDAELCGDEPVPPQRRLRQPVPQRPSNVHEVLATPHYERMRARLIRIFAARGSMIAEELADETIARVVEKLDSLSPKCEGNPAYYFYAVARYVYLEHTRKPKWTELDPARISRPSDFELSADEETLNRLEKCLAQLDEEDRHLITTYYGFETKEAHHRRALADELGIEGNALRLRVYRLRRRLGRCVEECDKKMPWKAK